VRGDGEREGRGECVDREDVLLLGEDGVSVGSIICDKMELGDVVRVSVKSRWGGEVR
jgi:hypothetical protein